MGKILFITSKFEKRLKFQYFVFSYIKAKLLLATQSNMQNISDELAINITKITMATVVPMNYPLPLKRYVVSNAFVDTGCVNLYYLYSQCSGVQTCNT